MKIFVFNTQMSYIRIGFKTNNMTTLKKQLENIYNANQCTDINDVDYAIEETKKLCVEYPKNIAPKMRLASLTKRKTQLTK
jgi:hypothetical protein